MENEGIFKKSLIYFLGNMSTRLITVLLIPLYAFYIRPEDMGTFDYSQTIVNFVLPFAYIAVWESILKFILPVKDEQKRTIYLSSSVFISLIMTLIIIMFTTILIVINNERTNAIDYIYISAMTISLGLAQIWQYYARALGKNLIFVYSGAIGAVVNLVITFFLVVLLDWGIEALYISFILSQLSILISIDFKLSIFKKINFKKIDRKTIKEMAVFSFPLVLNLSMMWFFLGFGKFLIVHNLGTEENGMYAFATKISFAVGMIGSVITMAVIENAIVLANDPSFGEKFAKTIEDLFRLFQSLMVLFLPVAMIFYKFIQNTDYSASFDYIPWLLFYTVIMAMSSNIGSVFQAINKTKYQFTTTVAGAIVTVLISYFLIRVIGIYAILIGQSLGAFTMMMSRYALVNRFIRFKVNWKPIFLLFLLFVLNAFVHVRSSVITIAICSSTSIVLLCYINRKTLLNLSTIIKRRILKH